MSWKRLLISIPLGILIMIADVLLLVLVNKLYLPSHPPRWLWGGIFFFDAWPVLITQHLFPGAGRAPTPLAIVSAALIDLIIFTAIIYALFSWRARRKARA